MWWFVLFCNILIPLIMIVSGIYMYKFPPKKINRILGYRTRRSMKNADTWQFAHRHSGRTVGTVGLVMLILSGLIMLPFYRSNPSTLGTMGTILFTVQTIVLILSFIPTEIALKKTFHDDGTRK